MLFFFAAASFFFSACMGRQGSAWAALVREGSSESSVEVFFQHIYAYNINNRFVGVLRDMIFEIFVQVMVTTTVKT